MRATVNNFPVRRKEVIFPLIFYVDECPLSAAEEEMLQPRKLKKILLPVFARYPIRLTVTPDGTEASSTVTS